MIHKIGYDAAIEHGKDGPVSKTRLDLAHKETTALQPLLKGCEHVPFKIMSLGKFGSHLIKSKGHPLLIQHSFVIRCRALQQGRVAEGSQ
jgi:hypothetical protein